MKWNRSLPNGTKDKLFKEAILSHQLEELVNHHFGHRGYQRIETPLIEFEEVFDAMEQRNSSRYRFFDEQGRIVVLRPDMTLPVGRVISTTGVILPVQLYYSGKIFRVSKGNSGEYNEQLQAGMELIGFDSLKAEMECLTNAITVSKKSGLSDFQIELGHAAIYQTIVTELDLSEYEQEDFKLLLQSKNSVGIQNFLKEFKTHNLYPLVSRLPRLFGSAEILQEALELTDNKVIIEAITEMEILIEQIKQLFPTQVLTVDIGAVQEFKHYTGMTFKGYSDQSSDCFLSGGRYDDLLTAFSAEPVPAVGIVFFLDRIIYIKERKNELPKPKGVQTLIHFETPYLATAENLLEKESKSSLSLHTHLADTLDYAKQWQIPRVLYVSETGVEERFISEVGKKND